MPLSPGSRLGAYEIGPLIGSGGMGEVYAATDTRLDRPVAIKVLPAELAPDHGRRERFAREAKAIAALNHPHICTLYDVGHEDGADFLVMEHLEGESLQDRLAKGGIAARFNARLSPDGRWLAYASDEAGISQVYVQPFPAVDARFQISSSGGNEPAWSRDGRQLFYRGTGAMWAVSVAPGETFEAGIAVRLFDDVYNTKALSHHGYDVGPDGRFLVTGRESQSTQILTVVLNWHQELKARVPVH